MSQAEDNSRLCIRGFQTVHRKIPQMQVSLSMHRSDRPLHSVRSCYIFLIENDFPSTVLIASTRQVFSQIPQLMQAASSHSTMDAPLIPTSFSSAFKQLFWHPVTPNLNLCGSSLANNAHPVFCNIITVNISTRAYRRSLTGCNRTDTRSTHTRLTSPGCQHFLNFFYIVKFDKWDFHTLTGSQMYVSVSVFSATFAIICKFSAVRFPPTTASRREKLFFVSGA